MSILAMAAEISSLRPHQFMILLSSAVCEWVLMLLLFVNAALSYLFTNFAHYCKLDTPCLFCSRLECGFRRKQPGFYWNLLCSNHREEISSLVSCSIHGNFANVNGMCEECLAPILGESGSCRLLVGKTLVDVDKSVLQTMLLNKTVKFGSSPWKACSCCGKAWKAKTDAERLLELNSVVNVVAKVNVKPPLPRILGRSRFCRRYSLKRLRDKCPAKRLRAGSSGGDAAMGGGYRKRKISSHSDTEVLLSDNESTQNIRSCETYSEPDYDAQCDESFPLKAVDDNAILEKTSSQPQPHLLDLHEQKNVGSLSSDASQSSHNLEFSNNKLNPFSELISVDDDAQQPVVAKDSFVASNSDVPLPQISLTDALMKPMKMDGGISESGDASAAKHIEAAVETSLDGSCSFKSSNMHGTDSWLQPSEPVELLDNQALEETNACDSAQVEEHLRSQPLASTSNLVTDSGKEYSVDNDSGPQGPLVAAMLTKDDSNNEAADGLTLSDISHKSIIDSLKHQIALDQSYINSLKKELEEERNAAAIAANQAMAMITKLQEEKAALKLEALQYLRMMEEQAEYDMDALARANDLLAEREKELQDLEYELDFYREYAGVDDAASDLDSSTPTKLSKANGNSVLLNSAAEDTKAYISQCLNKLEKTLHQSCRNDEMGTQKMCPMA